MNLATWLFGPRVLQVNMSDRVIADELFLTHTIDMQKVEDCRLWSISNQIPAVYEQEVGFIYGGKVTVKITFDGKP